MPKIKRRSTQHQKKLIRLISDNLSKDGPAKTLEQLMLDAGYAKSTARQQAMIMAGIRDDLQPIVQRLDEERQRAINLLPKKIQKAKYRDLIDGIDKLTKNAQLLSGGKTANDNHTFKWEQ